MRARSHFSVSPCAGLFRRMATASPSAPVSRGVVLAPACTGAALAQLCVGLAA